MYLVLKGLTLRVIPRQIACLVMIFLISGLKLSTAEMKAAVASYQGIVFGLSSILFFTSVIGIKLTQEVNLRARAVVSGGTSCGDTGVHFGLISSVALPYRSTYPEAR